MADSPSLRETLSASLDRDRSFPSILSSTSMDWILYPIFLMLSPGSSMVSSMVSMRWDRGNSNISADSMELFPAPLAPHMRKVARFCTRNDSSPAVAASTVPLAMSLVRVHGFEECFLMATASPFGLMGYPTTVALASWAFMSVSRTGLDSQNGRPLSLLSTFIRLSTSLLSTTRLVLQRTWELLSPTPDMVTCMRFLSHGASMYISSSFGSDRRMSKTPRPTE